MPPKFKTKQSDIIKVDNDINAIFNEKYNNLSQREKNLVDSIAIGVPLDQIYSEYFNGYEHDVHMRNALYRGLNDRDIAKFAKEKLVSDVIRGKKDILDLIAERRRQNQDIIIETFRKRALETCITREFVSNELLKLREKINQLDTEKQVKYEMRLLEIIEKSISNNSTQDKVTTNIQINNNIPG